MRTVEIRDGTKRCAYCGQWLALDMFSRSATGPARRYSWCRRCRKEHGASRTRPQASLLAAQRGCLKCGHKFASTGPGNRICPRCCNANVGLPAPRRIKE
ncbi:MAG: hypothetical protein NTU94_08315 [Planctomycetota bacterium]|nr:hypothetical protein [Planctomycetota bacterium]